MPRRHGLPRARARAVAAARGAPRRAAPRRPGQRAPPGAAQRQRPRRLRRRPARPRGRGPEAGRRAREHRRRPGARRGRAGRALHARTDGNPFFALQFVDSLVERGHIAFDPAGWAWRCDLDAIRAHGPSADVAALVAERLRRVPQPLQALAHLAACLGPHADLERLAALAGLAPAELRDQLQALARDGILTPVGASFRFSHERVRDAALELVPSDERRAMHLAIGRALLAEPASLEQPARAFEIADHIKLCADLVVDAHEREQAARACIVAARAAHAAGSFAAGASYCASGVALLGPAAWREHPAAMFELAFLGARCAWPQGDYDAANRVLGELLGRAASRHQRVRLLHERVDLSLARVDIATGYIATVQCLGLFGRSLPLVPPPELVAARHAEVELRLGARAIEELAALPPVADPEVRALLGLLRSFAPIAFAFNRPLRDLAACEMMALTLTHGLSEAAPHAAANYAGFLTETLGRLDDGRRFSSLARALIERPELGAERARVLNFCVLVDAWTCPPKELIELCHVGYQAAVEAGDRVSTCLHAMQLAFGRIAQGRPLGEVLLHAERGLALSRDVAFRYVDDALTAAQRFVMALRGETDDVARLGGADFDEAAFAARLAAQPFGLPIYNYWILAIQARFLGGDLAGAWELAERIADVRNRGSVASPFAPWAGFFGALAAAALVERAAPEARPRMRALLVDEEARLAVLAAHAPHNFRSKHLLLAAERARLDGDHGAVLPLFEAAIRAARESGFAHEEAIGCELAARFLADQAVEIGARAYWRKAHRGYLGWGASGKARLLEAQHPHLAALAELARAPRAPASDLDMMTLAAASQAIAGELVLDRLVPLLLRVTVESTGARRGHLVLCDGDGLAVHAGFDAASGAHTDEVVATDTPGVLAWSVVRYAQRTLRPVLLDEATADRRFSADAHIVARRPRSVLCVPIVRRREAVGALYLEHDLVAGAFRPERVALVEHLAAQAAVSLENARLFGELRRAEGHVATLTAQTPIALFATDARGVLTEARGRALDAVAPDGSELLGRSLFELY
ncbi:MAG: GAF domain-containing protein [Myxococcota bacterium]